MSKIAWTRRTWNPIAGCCKCSPGCAHCYAERMAFRLAHMGQVKYQRVVDSGGWNGRIFLDEKTLGNVPRSGPCFVCSMCDLFGPDVPDEWIFRVYNAIRSRMYGFGGYRGCTFQVLTKHPERAADLLTRMEFDAAGEGKLWLREKAWPAPFVSCLKNHWFGVTVENQEWADRRIPELLRIPSAVRFVSCEPLLGPIDFSQVRRPAMFHRQPRGWDDWWTSQIRWVIIGCESGPQRRPCRTEWVNSLLHQCHVAGVRVFLKQFEIDGKVVHDAAVLAEYFGYEVEQIRQWPNTDMRTVKRTGE